LKKNLKNEEIVEEGEDDDNNDFEAIDEETAIVNYEFFDFGWKRNEGFKEFICYSDTGFVDKELFAVIIRKVQELWELEHEGVPLYLLGDNCRIHTRFPLMVEMAMKDIYLIFLPPNTTQFSQPLDSNPFAGLKKNVYKLLEKKNFINQLLGYDPEESKWTIPEAQQAARVAFTPKVIIAGFRNTAIWPWDEEKFLQLAKNNFDEKKLLEQDELKKICIELCLNLIKEARESRENRKNNTIRGHAEIRRNYCFDLEDHRILNEEHEKRELEKEEKKETKKLEKKNKRRKKKKKIKEEKKKKKSSIVAKVVIKDGKARVNGKVVTVVTISGFVILVLRKMKSFKIMKLIVVSIK